MLYLGLATLFLDNIKLGSISSCFFNLSNSSLGVFFLFLVAFAFSADFFAISALRLLILSSSSRFRCSCFLTFLAALFLVYSKIVELSKFGDIFNKSLFNELFKDLTI